MLCQIPVQLLAEVESQLHTELGELDEFLAPNVFNLGVQFVVPAPTLIPSGQSLQYFLSVAELSFLAATPVMVNMKNLHKSQDRDRPRRLDNREAIGNLTDERRRTPEQSKQLV